jgi:hypothetical protein
MCASIRRIDRRQHEYSLKSCASRLLRPILHKFGRPQPKQTAKVQIGTQVYFAFYNPATLAGS